MAERWTDPAAASVAPPMSFEEPYEVIGIERRTPTIVELWLRPLGSVLEYLPGEYVLLEDRDRMVPPRSFSIANAPRSDGQVSFLVTRVPDGDTSTWVHERLRVGETVRLSGPYGTFADDPMRDRTMHDWHIGAALAPRARDPTAQLPPRLPVGRLATAAVRTPRRKNAGAPAR